MKKHKEKIFMKTFLFFLILGIISFSSPLRGEDEHSKDRYLAWLERSVLKNQETMIGKARLDAVWKLMSEVERNQIPGDFIETGVWRGGTCIFMKGFLKAHKNTERKVWVADSFEGFPPTNRPEEQTINNIVYHDLVVPLEVVKSNFSKYHLLDDQVCFLKGFFSQTLPSAPIEKLALLRLDGDLYESTMDALTYLYPKLSISGYIIIDDYGCWPGCAAAVEDYRHQNNINDPLTWEDSDGVHWQKTH